MSSAKYAPPPTLCGWNHDCLANGIQARLGVHPKSETQVKVGAHNLANAFLQFAATLLQSSRRLVKRTRALLESNPPGITNRRLISMMSEGVAARSRPLRNECLLMSFRMP
jgi:hypothetical protein